MKAAAFFLLALSMYAAVLAQHATMPLFISGCQCQLAEAEAPTATDEADVRAASARLMAAAAALCCASMTMRQNAAGPAGALVSLCACVAVALTAYRAWDVALIIFARAGHVQGLCAVCYWVTLAAPVAMLLLVVLSRLKAVA